MAYSQDLRERVLDFVSGGGSKKAAAERINVGLSTVFLWCKTPEKLKAEKPGPKGCSKLDLDRLRAMLSARPTAYQAELAYLLGVSQPTVWLGIKRLKLTRKKNDDVPRERRHV